MIRKIGEIWFNDETREVTQRLDPGILFDPGILEAACVESSPADGHDYMDPGKGIDSSMLFNGDGALVAPYKLELFPRVVATWEGRPSAHASVLVGGVQEEWWGEELNMPDAWPWGEVVAARGYLEGDVLVLIAPACGTCEGRGTHPLTPEGFSSSHVCPDCEGTGECRLPYSKRGNLTPFPAQELEATEAESKPETKAPAVCEGEVTVVCSRCHRTYLVPLTPNPLPAGWALCTVNGEDTLVCPECLQEPAPDRALFVEPQKTEPVGESTCLGCGATALNAVETDLPHGWVGGADGTVCSDCCKQPSPSGGIYTEEPIVACEDCTEYKPVDDDEGLCSSMDARDAGVPMQVPRDGGKGTCGGRFFKARAPRLDVPELKCRDCGNTASGNETDLPEGWCDDAEGYLCNDCKDLDAEQLVTCDRCKKESPRQCNGDIPAGWSLQKTSETREIVCEECSK